MEYVRVFKENGELDKELTMLENARINAQFNTLDKMSELLDNIRDIKKLCDNKEVE